MKVASNSGPLMALAKVGQVHLFYPLYGIVLVPSAVYEESVAAGLEQGHADAVAIEMEFQRQHLQIVALEEAHLSPPIAGLPIDRGEKHTIQLALDENCGWVLLDDMRARQEARDQGLRVKGTLGVLVDAFRQHYLSTLEIEVIFAALLKRDDIWIAEELIRQVWDHLKQSK